MDIEYWVAIALLTVAAIIYVIVKVVERREQKALIQRLHDDPEFARQYHEQHRYDDWEDMGYFDGR